MCHIIHYNKQKINQKNEAKIKTNMFNIKKKIWFKSFLNLLKFYDWLVLHFA